MFKLANNPILFPHQQQILKLFFASSFGKQFFLTGGTALSAFYLQHRESQDLDFFTLQPFDTLEMDRILRDIAGKMQANYSSQQRSPTYNEVYLEDQKQKWKQKIDIVLEQPKHFGKIEETEGVRFDSLVNISTNKILAIFGRLEPKDYIDLYVILQKTELEFDKLFEMAKEKDTGLSEFYFANTIADATQFNELPKMKITLDKKAFIRFYQDLAKKLLLQIKPQIKNT